MPKRKLEDVVDEEKEEKIPEQISVDSSETGEVDCDPPRRNEIHAESASTNHAHIPSTSTDADTLTAVPDDRENQRPTNIFTRKSVKFSSVTVYLFPRTQGFTCIPSSGGSTLGMTREHSEIQNFSLEEHEQECRSSRAQFLLRQRQLEGNDLDEELGEEVEEEEGEEEEEEEEEEVEEDECDDLEDAYSFPVAIPVRQRRNLLKEAGCQVDNSEKSDCQFIRNSREACGCQCQNVCIPEECACSLNKIQCQVDRYSYPCGCTKEGCGNESGRVEFNPVRVKNHYLNTISRLTTNTNQESDTNGCSVSVQQNYLCYENSLPGTNAHVEMYSRHETYVQAPQCDYAYTALSSASSYQMPSENYASVCQPHYDYYHMQTAYNIDSPAATMISSSPVSEPPCTSSDNYICMEGNVGCYYTPSSAPLISPVLDYNNPQMFSSLTPDSFPSESHVNQYESSPSDGGSGDSSSSEQNSGTLDFGELIKQSLVETVTA